MAHTLCVCYGLICVSLQIRMKFIQYTEQLSPVFYFLEQLVKGWTVC